MKNSLSILAAVIIFSFISTSAANATDEHLYDDEYREDCQEYSLADNQGYQTDEEEEFYSEVENRETMAEMVNDIGLDDDDQEELVEYVIQEGAEASSNGLRDSDISDAAWEQITDDARFE